MSATLNTPIVSPSLNCTDLGISRQGVFWQVNPDGSMGKISAGADFRPYDPVANKMDPRICRLSISDYVALATGLAAVNRPLLAQAMAGNIAAALDLINNGIPDNLKAFGSIDNGFQ